MPLFYRGLIHLGDERLSRDSRRKQCSYVNLLAFLTEQSIQVFEWKCWWHSGSARVSHHCD